MENSLSHSLAHSLAQEGTRMGLEGSGLDQENLLGPGRVAGHSSSPEKASGHSDFPLRVLESLRVIS